MTTTDVIAGLALFIALYGAGLSTLIYIRDRQKATHQVTIICDLVFWEESKGGGGLVQIRAVNTGYRPITLVDAGLRMSDGKNLKIMTWGRFGQPPLPKKLSEGESMMISFERYRLEEVLKAYVAESRPFIKSSYVKSVDGREYETKFPKDLNDQIVGTL
jgi:hypothetical protein